MTGHDFATSGFLKIKNVKCLLRARDDVRRPLSGLRQAGSFEEGGDSAKRGYIGAGR
jgi:hypothetical protein